MARLSRRALHAARNPNTRWSACRVAIEYQSTGGSFLAWSTWKEEKEGHFPSGGGDSSSGRERDREAATNKYRGTSLTKKRNPLGPYRRPMPRDLGGSYGDGRFLMSEVALQGRTV